MRDRKKKVHEDLKGEIRHLKKVIKHLKKETGKAEKKARRQQYEIENFTVEEEIANIPEIKNEALCDVCDKPVQVIDLLKQGKFYKCLHCKTQKRKKT